MEKSIITKPMLASKAPPDLANLTYPLLASEKLDGIRCLVINGKAVSRTFKPIPNDHIRTAIEDKYVQNAYTGSFDGEILVRNRTFNELSGDVRRSDGEPDFFYAVFDVVGADLAQPYEFRMDALRELSLPHFCKKILPVQIDNPAALLQYEEKCISEGFEGVMVRSPGSPYKCGRSTTSEGYLLKVKRFEQDEAEIIGTEEMRENQNIAERDNFGRTKRSTHAENMVPKGTLGKLVCRTPAGVEFGCGTGMTDAVRAQLWAVRDSLVGKFMTYKHQPSGAKEGGAPRLPVFIGLRDDWDMSE